MKRVNPRPTASHIFVFILPNIDYRLGNQELILNPLWEIYKNDWKDLYQSRPIFFVWGRGRGDRQWVTMPQNINQNIFYLFWVLFYLFPKSWKINKIDYVNFFPIYPPFLGKGGGRGVPHEYSCKKSSIWFKYLDDFEFRVFSN